ncbi:MAG: nucleotide exchange factor GrpE [Candidatus Liptonbacteria bacterium]|nr:nucleotide exchange factor GrpE [Candidatus Liptonbacteria bacterium]
MDEIKQNPSINPGSSQGSGGQENNRQQAPKADAAPEDKLAAAEKQRDEYLAGWQRARADFINYKKEETARLESVIRFANEDILEEMIEILDSFDLGLTALEKAGPVEKGVYMIRSKLEDAIKQRGVEKLPVKVGDKFDPSLSEAVVEMESEQPAGTIVEIIAPGYKLHDKILRPARVKVSKGK